MSAARTYVTDDRDDEKRNYLEVVLGENGDYYVAIAPVGEKTAGRAVRICTSGGAARECPPLVAAVAAIHRALGPRPPTTPSVEIDRARGRIHRELNDWRWAHDYTDHEHDGAEHTACTACVVEFIRQRDARSRE